ncbi:MAG: histidine phosphatase family protein [Sandaracinaceae bacterium]|nr:histidine phosphatase family protein [Sandaracinaceae bacterium]
MTATRRVVLMRHAKSSWKTGASDHERPLNGRGRRDAPRIGAELAERGWVPDHVSSSDSERTRETFARMRDALGFEGDPDFRHDLYHAGIEAVRGVVGALPDSTRVVLVLGHNPGWEEALAWLTGRDEEMKTGSCALLRVDADTWSDAMDRAAAWQLEALIHPREI